MIKSIKKKYLKIEFTKKEINKIKSFRRVDKKNSISYKKSYINFIILIIKVWYLKKKTIDNKLIAKHYGETIILKSTKFIQDTKFKNIII